MCAKFPLELSKLMQSHDVVCDHFCLNSQDIYMIPERGVSKNPVELLLLREFLILNL